MDPQLPVPRSYPLFQYGHSGRWLSPTWLLGWLPTAGPIWSPSRLNRCSLVCVTHRKTTAELDSAIPKASSDVIRHRSAERFMDLFTYSD